MLQVGHDQQRLEPAEDPVAAPVLGQLDRGAREVGGVAVELLLELLVQGQRVGHRPGEPRQHLAALEGAHLGGPRLHHGLADGDLPVAAEGDAAVLADGEDGGAVELGHVRVAPVWVSLRLGMRREPA